jgi:hypothetical protein
MFRNGNTCRSLPVWRWSAFLGIFEALSSSHLPSKELNVTTSVLASYWALFWDVVSLLFFVMMSGAAAVGGTASKLAVSE